MSRHDQLAARMAKRDAEREYRKRMQEAKLHLPTRYELKPGRKKRGGVRGKKVLVNRIMQYIKRLEGIPREGIDAQFILKMILQPEIKGRRTKFPTVPSSINR